MKVSSAFLLLIAVSSLALSACTKPYNAPAFDAGGEELPATDRKVQFGGIAAQLPQHPTRVLWTHGMCTHGWGWAIRTTELLNAALKATRNDRPKKNHPSGSSTFETTISKPSEQELEVWFYIWSPMTSSLKQRLYFDNSADENGEFNYKRAGLNKKLKRALMNDCLADAVIVAGPNRARLYEDARREVCSFLGGRLTDSTSCEFAEKEPSETRRSIVAESLGSKIIADAVLGLKAAPGQEIEFQGRLSTIRQIYFIANQIPILSLATKKAGPKGTLARMVDRIQSAAVRNKTPTTIQVVAFTDPNDLLSYRLTENQVDPEKTTLVNVIVSNDWTFTPLIPAFSLERPDTAHCDYRRNKDVVAMIAVGNPGHGEETWKQVRGRLQTDESKGC